MGIPLFLEDFVLGVIRGEVSTISTVAPGMSRAPSEKTSLSADRMTALEGVSVGGADRGVATYSMCEGATRDKIGEIRF